MAVATASPSFQSNAPSLSASALPISRPVKAASAANEARARSASVESSWRVRSSSLAAPAAASSAAASTDAVAVFAARTRSESSFATSSPAGMRGASGGGLSSGSGATGGLPTGALFAGPCAPPTGGWTGTGFGMLALTGGRGMAETFRFEMDVCVSTILHESGPNCYKKHRRVAGWRPRHAPGRREGRGAGAHPLILNMYQPGGALL